MSDTDEFTRLMAGARALELVLDEPRARLLLSYLDELHQWNQTYNLSGIKSREAMLSRHLLDALAVHPYLAGSRWIDVGAGAGIPGIPLAIVQPTRSFWLLDSAGKKARFMRHAVRTLGLTNVMVLECRVEDYGPDRGWDGPFDGVIARAFAPIDRLLALTSHLLKDRGRVLAMQGPNQSSEVVSGAYTLRERLTLTVPGAEGERYLSIIEKNPEAGH
ncbi:MAG: 16S rRNA (guanine(527)-N(7))-methyltransferase RsmG [Lysobacterales bacterium]